jgi:tRNA dimethylallyltransferase
VPRATLHARIDARTPRLLEEGGVEEIRILLGDGRPLSQTAARAHGVADAIALLQGQIDAAECERRLATRTRQYAKRQDTWLRRLPNAELVDADRLPADVAAEIAERLRTPPR